MKQIVDKGLLRRFTGPSVGLDFRVALATVAWLALAACQNNSTATPSLPTGTPPIVATVNGEPITAETLDKAAASQLKQVESQVYQIKKNTLDDLIEGQLLKGGAQKAGKSVDAYLKEEIESKVTPPTEEQRKQFYEQRKSQVGGRTYEQVKEQIQQVLTQSQTQNARNTLLTKLRASADVTIHLEPPRVKVEGGDNPGRGPKDAPIQIVEWTDYQCPFCGKSRATVNQIFTTYGDKVHYVIRDFPLSFHQNAFKAHEAGHCAGDQGKYWEMSQLLFGNQSALELPKLKGYAKQLKLDTGKFDKCLESDKHKAKVQENLEAGTAVGVSGTPAFFVNGVNISGARPFEDFKGIIDSELAKTK